MDKCQCGSVLSSRAKKCKECHMANVTKRWTCVCGNKMDKRSKKKTGLCRDCYIKLVNTNGEAKCITCGESTSEPRANYCKTCWLGRPVDGPTMIRRRARLKAWFKLSLEDYDEMLRKQNNKCAICLIDQSELSKSLSIDHDRKCCPEEKSCGKCVRGLLCSNCNFAIGLLKDNEVTIQMAYKYVTTYNKENN